MDPGIILRYSKILLHINDFTKMRSVCFDIYIYIHVYMFFVSMFSIQDEAILIHDIRLIT